MVLLGRRGGDRTAALAVVLKVEEAARVRAHARLAVDVQLDAERIEAKAEHRLGRELEVNARRVVFDRGGDRRVVRGEQGRSDGREKSPAANPRFPQVRSRPSL